jgi:hypothetical protein
MTPPQLARALYLDAEAEGVFALLHEASEPRGDTAVLLSPPFGWEPMFSYDSVRDGAKHLAAQGYSALRIDLPGSGDSAGNPDDPGRLEGDREEPVRHGAAPGSTARSPSLSRVTASDSSTSMRVASDDHVRSRVSVGSSPWRPEQELFALGVASVVKAVFVVQPCARRVRPLDLGEDIDHRGPPNVASIASSVSFAVMNTAGP